MSSLDLRHLNLVLAIHEENTLTAAALRLNVTQSALSHQLSDVEERLRAQLFLRVRKKLVLTAAGEAVLRIAAPVLQQVRAVEDEIRHLSDDSFGTITISTQCYTCYHWLPPLLTRFQKKYPNVEVNIDADATREPYRYLQEGRLDVAIVNTKQDGNAMRYTPLFEDELVLLVPEDHPLAGETSVRPARVAGEHLILHTRPEENGFVQNVLVPAGVRAAKYSTVTLTEAIVEMVRAGMGISAMADWAAAPYVRQGGLRTVPVTRRGIRRQWYAATLRRPRTPVYLERFIEVLASISG